MSSRNLAVLFVGIRGSGKSTIIKQISTDSILNSFYFNSYSSILKMVVNRERKNFIQFDGFPPNIKLEYRKKVINYLQTQRISKHLFIEGHLSMYNSTTSNYEILFNQMDLNFFDIILYFSIEPLIILERRKEDELKQRNMDLDIIINEIKFEEKYLHSLKKIKRIHIMESESQLVQFLKNLIAD